MQNIYKRCKLRRVKWQDWESRTGSILGNKAPWATNYDSIFLPSKLLTYKQQLHMPHQTKSFSLRPNLYYKKRNVVAGTNGDRGGLSVSRLIDFRAWPEERGASCPTASDMWCGLTDAIGVAKPRRVSFLTLSNDKRYTITHARPDNGHTRVGQRQC